MGCRLGELTKENTKCKVPVNGVRLIVFASEIHESVSEKDVPSGFSLECQSQKIWV